MNIQEFEAKVESIVGKKVDFNVFYSMYHFEFSRGELLLANRKNGNLISLLDDERNVLLKKEYLIAIGEEKVPEKKTNFLGKLQNDLFKRRKNIIDTQNLIIYKSLEDRFNITDSNGKELDLKSIKDLPSLVEMSCDKLEVTIVTSQELSQVTIISKYEIKEDFYLENTCVIGTLSLETNNDGSKENYKERFLNAINLFNKEVIEYYERILDFVDKIDISLSDINLDVNLYYGSTALEIKNSKELGFEDVLLVVEKENIYLYNVESGYSEKMTFDTSKERFNEVLEEFREKHIQALNLIKAIKEKQKRIGEMSNER